MKKTPVPFALAALLCAAALLAPFARAAEPAPLPKELPPYGPDKPLPVPAIAKSTLPNGLAVWLVVVDDPLGGEPVALVKIETNDSAVDRTEIATVGVTQKQVDEGSVNVASIMLPLRGNARAKMQGVQDGFVKLFCLPVTGIIVGGVVVAPKASELIHSIALAVSEKITVDQFSHDFTVYPSMSGSIAEAARQLHLRSHPEEASPTQV